MNNYIFLTDSNSDLPYTLKDSLGIEMIYMPYVLDGQEYYADLGRNEQIPDFYKRMRNGAVPVTASLSTQNYIDYFEELLKQDKDILFLAFSSALSSTINCAREAKDIVLKSRPNRRIEIVDTLSISAPETALLLKAHELYAQGMSMDDLVNWILENRLNAQVVLTVEDLVYFKRGGRISGTAAFVGTVLGLKPIIVLNKEGKIIPIEKVQGRKKAITTVFNKFKANMESVENTDAIVLHADCLEEAQSLEKKIRKEFPNIKSVRIQDIGPVIGTHSGPGTIGIAFMGKPREY